MNAGAVAPRATLITSAGVVALVLLAAVAQPEAGVSPFVTRVAVLALAGGAAYLLDDAAAQLTSVTPPGVWRRRAPALGTGVGVLAAAWVVVLLVLAWQDSRPPVGVASGELTVLCLFSVAAAAVLFRRGDPQPGARVAPVVLLSGVCVVIAESVLRTSVLLPWDGAGAGRSLETAWVGLGLVATIALLLASRDPAAAPGTGLWVKSPRRRSNDSGST
jgi:hypothetical protein